MIYLDHAATAFPRARGVAGAVATALDIAGSAGRGAHGGARQAGSLVDECRARAADLLGGDDPRRVVIFPSSTLALSTAIADLCLGASAQSTLLIGPLEHNAVWRPAVRGLSEERVLLLPRSNSSDCLPLLAEAAGDHRDGRGFEILREPTPIGQFRSHRSLFGRTFQRQGGETKPLIEVLTEFFLQVFTTQVALGSLGLLLRPRQEPGGLGASIGGIAGGTVALLDPSQESPGYLADDS